MNATKRALHAYSAAHSSTRTAKSIEYEAVARITARLREAAKMGASGFPALAMALHDNKRLWMAFVIDIAQPANPLPAELKAGLYYLAQFTHHHSSLVLNRQASVDPLMEINTAIMRGLRKGVS